MYIVTAKSTGSRTKSTHGLARISEARSPIEIFFASIGAYHLSSPVSLRLRWALRFKIVGACVSGCPMTTRQRQTPEKIVSAQNSHLDVQVWYNKSMCGLQYRMMPYRKDTPETPINPPTAGPIAGPEKGENVKIATAIPRVLKSHRSPRTGGLIARGEAPAHPAMKRKTMMLAVFLDRAQAI